MMRILDQSLIPNFGESEPVFHHAKHVFHFGSYFRLIAISGSLAISESHVATALLIDKIFGLWCMSRNDLVFTRIGRITPDTTLVAVEQIVQNYRIVNIGRGSYYRMNQLGFAVDTNMGLHTEVPLVTFARLVHIRVALLLLVLGGTRCVNNSGVNDGSPVYFQAILREILIDQMKQSITQVVAFHQMAKSTDGRFVRGWLLPKIDAHKLAHRARVVKNLLSAGVRQVEPVL